MTVYIVHEGVYDWIVIGVYATLDAAKAAHPEADEWDHRYDGWWAKDAELRIIEHEVQS